MTHSMILNDLKQLKQAEKKNLFASKIKCVFLPDSCFHDVTGRSAQSVSVLRGPVDVYECVFAPS